MLCPACQTENKDGAKFCRGCGDALALRCPACGTPYEAADAFCDECGTSLAATPVAAPLANPIPHDPAAVASAELRMVSVMLGSALDTLAPASEIVRQAWPDTFQAAIELGRVGDARQLIAVLAERPPGHIPPFLDAHIIRAGALIEAAEDRHDTFEVGLRDAVERFTALGYPYWLAVTLTDLAEWVIGQGRPAEAEPLLTEAVAALEPLRAAPALRRAQELMHADPAASVTEATA